jgi:phosphotransferase system HPr (HPr) family protein
MDEPKAARTVVVSKPEGLHARPAELFVRLANRFAASIEVIKDNQRVDAKSILGVLTLAAEQGTELRLEAVGGDAVEALDALVELVTNNFEVDGDLREELAG